MRHPIPWIVGQYDPTGGYDCMTGAYTIRDAEGHPVVTIDCAAYGQAPCVENNRARQLAGLTAIRIADAVNKFEGGQS